MELATLQIAIDSRQTKTAKEWLDDLTRSGERAEKAMGGVGTAHACRGLLRSEGGAEDLEATMTLQDVEIITPEGRFASIRVPTVIDAFGAGWYAPGGPNAESLMRLCALCVTLYGEAVTNETLGNLPMYELDAITAKLVELMKEPPKGKKA